MIRPDAEWIGRVLGGTYRVVRALGHGGMGAVFAVQHVRTGGLLAAKVLHREVADNAEVYKRFQDEARIVSALRHPHIVQVTDFDEDEDGTPFLIMELLDGQDLETRLRQAGCLPLGQVLQLARQVGSALQAAHDHGVVHRDIKPQNVFLCRHVVAGEVSEVAKVVDFGISKIRRSQSQMTRDHIILGTPHYMSPEAARGQHSQIDGRADQFALGVILYRALSGRMPFDGDEMMAVLYQVVHEMPPPLRSLAPGLPPGVAEAVERTLAKRKEDRFPSMDAFLVALQAGGAAAEVPRTLVMPSAPLQVVAAQTPAPQTPAPAPAPPVTTLSAASGQSGGMAPRRRVLVFGAVAGLACAGIGIALWSSGQQGGGAASRVVSQPAPAREVVVDPEPPDLAVPVKEAVRPVAKEVVTETKAPPRESEVPARKAAPQVARGTAGGKKTIQVKKPRGPEARPSVLPTF